MNPYATQLGARDPLTVIRSTLHKVEVAWNALTPDQRQHPLGIGKWNPRQILCHLADTELVFAFRLRQALAEPHHVIQPMDQNRWAEQYGAYQGADALAVFRAIRQWNLALVESLPPAVMHKPVTHPERGELTYRELLETMAGHDINHVRQLEALTGPRQQGV